MTTGLKNLILSIRRSSMTHLLCRIKVLDKKDLNLQIIFLPASEIIQQ